MKYDLTGNVVIEARLRREIDAANVRFMALPQGCLEQLNIGVNISVLVDALYLVNQANDAVERVNFIVLGYKHG